MLKVYIENLDPVQLQSRLDELLEQGGVRVPHNRYLVRSQEGGGRHWLMRKVPAFRRLFSTFTQWRLSGWSPRWIARRIPFFGPISWRIYGVITQREFRRHTLSELQQLSVSLQSLRNQVEQLTSAVGLSITPAVETMRHEHAVFSKQIQYADKRVRELERRIDHALSSGARLAAAAPVAEANGSEGWYLALENSLRGDVSDIAARLEHYLPYLDCAQVGQRGWPVLDLGCGRGEWLKLLRDRGLQARGVDMDVAMLEQARDAGLDVIHADLITALRATETSSIGAVTAFQVVEHLDQATLLELFQQALRVLRPGGVLLLETPNPENIQVGAYSFWLDPSHIRPIPPPLLAHSANYFGFSDISIVRSNPWRAELRLETDGEAARHLEKLLFSAQDYALIARKPYA